MESKNLDRLPGRGFCFLEGACTAAAVDLVLQVKEAPAGAELAEQVGQQLVMAVAIAALRAPAAIGDPAVTWCWRGRGDGGGHQQLVRAWTWCWPASVPRRAGGACTAAAVDLVQQLEEAQGFPGTELTLWRGCTD